MILIINPSTKFSTPQSDYAYNENMLVSDGKREHVLFETSVRLFQNVRLFEGKCLFVFRRSGISELLCGR